MLSEKNMLRMNRSTAGQIKKLNYICTNPHNLYQFHQKSTFLKTSFVKKKKKKKDFF